MKVVRDCPGARWLPSRHHFALARLVAFVIAHVEEIRPRLSEQHLLLAIDHDQSAIENYTVSIWIFCTVVCYIAAALPLPIGIAFLLATPLAAIAIQLPIYIGGMLMNSVKVTSVVMMGMMIVASSYFALSKTAIQYVAWFFFAVVILNSAAWLILIMLGHFVSDLEQRCGI